MSQPNPHALAQANLGSTIRVGVAFSSSLWNQLLVDSLNLVSGLCASEGAAAVLTPDLLAPSDTGVLLTGVPSAHEAWQRLENWCSRPSIRVLLLGENRPALAARALRLGAAGFLDWECPLTVLVKALRGVHAGEIWAERKVTMGLVRGTHSDQSVQLTNREQMVLASLAQGLRNKEIAARLAITETTVKSHLNRAYHKLNLTDRVQAALYVERHGL